MPADSTHRFGDSSAAQQRFLSLFLRSEREIFRYVAVLVPNSTDAEDVVQQTAMALWEKFDAYDPAQPFTPRGLPVRPEQGPSVDRAAAALAGPAGARPGSRNWPHRRRELIQ